MRLGMNRFKASLQSEWLKYVIVIMLSCTVWLFAFGLYHAPKTYEKIDLFFAGTVRDYTFEKVAADVFPDIRQVNIASSDPNANTFAHKYELVAFNGSDVVIVPESIAAQTYCAESFIEMPSMGEMYYQESVAYGVYIPSESVQALGKYFDFKEERYVVLIPGSSANAGLLTENAYTFVEWLVHYVQA